ncbi:MAG: erythromycin esterase family protein [Chitinophagales bacterium]
MKKITIIILILASNILVAQKSLNLDFEYEIVGSKIPKKWYIGDNGYKISLEYKEKFSREKSLKIESDNPTAKQFAVCTNSFPVEYALNKTIEFKGRIKTHAVAEGYAGLWWRGTGKKNAILSFDNMSDNGLIGDNEWTEVAIKIEVPDSTEKIAFGALLTGTGTAWFDNFEIFIDGAKFEDIEPTIIKPNSAQLEWLRKQIYPLQSFEPDFEHTEDLEILDKLVGDARVVALGENSHGSSEIFKMKHRIIKYLTQNKDFDIFSIEANMPEAYEINDYIIEGKKKPKELIKGMRFWTWKTQEVLSMVKWMKKQNKTNNKIQFTGFDMQFFFQSIKELKAAFEEQTDLLKDINELRDILEMLKDKKYQNKAFPAYHTKRANEIILEIKLAIEASSYNDDKKEWLLRNNRILEQFLGNSYIARDKYMAENFEWIAEQNPESKLTIWAHNEHIKKTGHSMGKHLAQSLKDDYLTIGFTFHKGTYTATGKNRLNTYQAQDSYEGTFEYFFQSLDEPMFLLDLRKIKNNDSEHGQWIKENLEFRKVGSRKKNNEFQETNLIEDYDMIIFINKSSNSILLK